MNALPSFVWIEERYEGGVPDLDSVRARLTREIEALGVTRIVEKAEVCLPGEEWIV